MKKSLLILMISILIGVFLYGYKNIICETIINKYYLPDLNIKIGKIKDVGFNKIKISSLYYEDNILDYGKIGVKFKNVDIYFNLKKLLFKKTINYIEFNNPSIKFYNIVFEKIINKNQFLKFIKEYNYIEFKNTIGFINCAKKTLDKTFIIKDKTSDRIFLKAVLNNQGQIKDIIFKSKQSGIYQHDKNIVFYPYLKKGFCDLDFCFSKSNDAYNFKINNIKLNKNSYSLDSNISFIRSSNKSEVYDTFSSSFKDNFSSFILNIVRKNKNIEVKAKINKIYSLLFNKSLDFNFDIDSQNRIKGVIGDEKRIYFNGVYKDKVIDVDLVIKDILNTGDNINIKINIVKNKELMVLNCSNIFFGSKKMPDMFISLYIKNKAVMIKDFRWGKSLVCGSGVINNDIDGKVKFKIDVNALDLEYLKPFLNFKLGKYFVGILSGNMEFFGKLISIETKGKIAVRNGIIDNINFKDSEIDFYKKGSIIKLNNAKIFRDSGLILLGGHIDTTKEDLLSTVTVTSKGKIMEWDGWHIGKGFSKDEFKVEKKINDSWSVAFKNIIKDNTRHSDKDLESAMQLEYKITETDKFMMKMESDDNFVGYKKQYDF